ncbi:MAG: hypothetical protein JSS99_02415 [Actinobacteria bacterium]|nr:hypothetical protein [Actinomycetota bacterium]
MTSRIRTLVALATVLALVAPAAARANQAYDQVAAAFEQGGGHLDPCAFTQAQLEAAVAGIPAAVRSVVPDLRRAMVGGIAAHMRGDCKGVKPTGGTAAGGVPPTAVPPVTTQPAPVAPATTAPATTAPTTTAPTTTAPTTTATPATQPATAPVRQRDRTPLVIALIAVGALVLLALLLWALARSRGWDPAWAARTRHGWGEAGFRTSSTWSEFTDWLRLGR